MDWKQFFASVIGSLAWPTVVVVLLLILRHQVASLARRLLKLTLPGGVEASFAEELEKSAEKVAEVVAEHPALPPPEPVPDPRSQELSEKYPALSVINSFRQVDNLLTKIAARLIESGTYTSSRLRLNQATTIEHLLKLKLIDRTVVELYNRLRHLRNIAAHGDPNDSEGISATQAVEYAGQVSVLTRALDNAYQELVAILPTG